MIRTRLSTADDSTDRTTRRSFLAGLGSLGLAGLGTATGRTNTATDSRRTDSQPGEGPFTDSAELEAFVTM